MVAATFSLMAVLVTDTEDYQFGLRQNLDQQLDVTIQDAVVEHPINSSFVMGYQQLLGTSLAKDCDFHIECHHNLGGDARLQ